MTKSELMENYTVEQLAEMVVGLEMQLSAIKNEKYTVAFRISADSENVTIGILEDGKVKEKVIPIENLISKDLNNDNTGLNCDRLYPSEELYPKIGIFCKCPNCAKVNKIEIDENSEQLIRNKLTNKIYELKSQLERKQNEINQIDEILNELFGVTHDAVKTPDEFERILKEKAESLKTISDFLPTEPIKVADMLINEYHTTDYMGFDISELRQIAEHLLVYCNTNKGEEV